MDERPRRSKGERGATSLEYLGLMALMLALLAMIFSFGLERRVRSGITSSICTIFQLGCSDPGEVAEPPPGPCITNRASEELHLGGGEVVQGSYNNSYVVERLSDGRYRVTASDDVAGGVGVGFRPGLVYKVGDDNVSLEGGATASAMATFATGQTFEFKDEKEATKFLQWHRSHYGNAVFDPVGTGLNWAWDGVSSIWRDNYSPPAPTVTYAEGGFDASAVGGGTAQLGTSGGAAEVDAVLKEALGARYDSTTKETTVYVNVDGTLALGAEAVEGGTVGGRGDVGGVMAVTLDENLEPRRATITTVRPTTANLTGLDQADGLGSINSVLGAGASPGASPSERTVEVEATLDLTDPTNRAAFDRVIAGGADVVARGPYVGGPEAYNAFVALARRFDDHSSISVLEYRQTRDDHINVDIIVANAGGDSVAEDLVSARYLDRIYGGMLPWVGCAP